MSEHSAENDAAFGQRVIHYPVGPDGAWWTEGGAHPGTQSDCPACVIPPVKGGES